MVVNKKLEFSTSSKQVRPSKTKMMQLDTILSQALEKGPRDFFEKIPCNVSYLEAFLHRAQGLPIGMLPENLKIKIQVFYFQG